MTTLELSNKPSINFSGTFSVILVKYILTTTCD